MKNFRFDKVYNIITEKVEGWLTDFFEMLPNLFVAIIAFIVFYFFAKLIKSLTIKGLKRVSQNFSLNYLIAVTLYVTTLLIGIFIAFDILDLEKTLTSLLAGLGILGLAFSLAFQDTATNFVSGVFLAIRTPIKIGDIVEIHDIMGTVQRINLRATEIETFQGTLVVIPNKNVFQNPIFNYTHTGRRRIDLEGRVSYQADLEEVRDIALKAIAKIDSVSKETAAIFQFDEFGESGVEFVIKAWVTDLLQPKFLETQHQIIIAIKKAFDENNIAIPLAIRTIKFDANDKEIGRKAFERKAEE